MGTRTKETQAEGVPLPPAVQVHRPLSWTSKAQWYLVGKGHGDILGRDGDVLGRDVAV